MPPKGRGEGTSALEIQLYPEQPNVPSGKVTIGVELTGPQLRLAVLPVGTKPNLSGNKAFQRTGFVCVGQHPWTFKPVNEAGRHMVSAQTAERVAHVIQELLSRLQIDPANVERITVGGVITFDSDGAVIRVSNDLLQDRLYLEFTGPEITVGSRVRAALNVERIYGAGKDYPESRRLLYLRLSENINVDAGDGQFEWSGDRIFARRIRHASVDRQRLEALGANFLAGQFDAPQALECDICGHVDCLHGFASGQGILRRVPDSAVDAVVQARNAGGQRFAEGDRGAQTTVAGKEIDSAAVFRGGANEILRRLVVQAGIAIGLALNEHVLGVYEPDLIVIGGTVPIGTRDEDESFLENRLTIDGIIQRTLAEELQDRYPRMRLTVTRSRFAGFTGLLGLTLPDGG